MGNIIGKFKMGDRSGAGLDAGNPVRDSVKIKGVFSFELMRIVDQEKLEVYRRLHGEDRESEMAKAYFNKHAVLVDDWEAQNHVTNEGIDDILEEYFNGSTYTASHFVGLTDGTPTTAVTDTLASHAGWVEITAYTGNRQAYAPAAASGKSIDNSASKAVFPITGTATVGGSFLATVATGSAGVLVAVVVFDSPGDRALVNLDTLNVTYTVSAADS